MWRPGEVDVKAFARLDRRRLTAFALLALTFVLVLVALTNMAWCMPALPIALALATALATWWLARDDLALDESGAIARLVITGLSVGLAFTWSGALVVAAVDVGAAAAWTMGEFDQVLRRFIWDTALHWTPLGLMAAFVGTGLSLIVDEISGTSAGREQHG
jgi:hypothetical protein